ncbi:hypothetical protein LX32DRAFT_97518 [Colletotrichum zoysiae]|uniref:BTB domain-containing protein n=1 Tax=Colletotrichum zoysiae TaxID=1216348 RepID=A0AAD9H9Z5_9PEZI|nr:hypothetical protein LX32DRAFT_97518 [Colletotrichum zoysiae]
MPPKRKAEDDGAMPSDRKMKTDDIFQSRIIKFIVGKDQAEFNVHEDVIAKISDPLRALVTNGMRESIEGKVVWEDVDMDTFTKLLQFAYEHDYTFTDPNERRDDGKSFTMNQRIYLVEWGAYTWPTELSRELADQFHDEASDVVWHGAENPFDQALYHSYGHYMSHVQLYILADRYGVLALMSLSVQKICAMLVNNPLTKDLFSTVWKLLEFIWPKTTSEDRLKKLLLRFLLVDLRDALDLPVAAGVLTNIPDIAVALMLMPSRGYWEEVSIV